MARGAVQRSRPAVQRNSARHAAQWKPPMRSSPARGSQALRAADTRLVPVPADDDGMRVDWAITQAPRARFAVVTPAHQSPLGVALSLPRRLALLAWAEANSAWVIEDDYDGEFHYAGRPL